MMPLVEPNDPWIEVGSMAVARKHHLCEKFVFNFLDVVVAVGGYNTDDELLDSVEVYYTVNRLCSRLQHAMPKRILATLINVNEHMHLIGGQK